MYVDLHAHTTASDGTFTPTELVHAAKQAGVSILAVTDHDTVAGVAEAQRAAAEVGLTLVPGVELSAQHRPGDLHLLGLFIDPQDATLNTRLAELSAKRATRNERMAKRLTELGAPITLEEVIAAAPPGANIGRPHFAAVLIQKGYVTTNREAFEQYLADDAPGYVSRDNLPPAEAIALVHAAGGKCFIAHPGLMRFHQHENIELIVRRLVDVGLDGLEVYYSKYTPSQTSEFLRLAKKYKLLLTGGSDFHGANKPDVPLGRVTDGARLPVERLSETLRTWNLYKEA